MSEYIGIVGSGADYELEIIHQTKKAYLLKSWDGEEIWMPKSCFDSDGSITEYGHKLFLDKLEEAQ